MTIEPKMHPVFCPRCGMHQTSISRHETPEMCIVALSAMVRYHGEQIEVLTETLRQHGLLPSP